MFTQKNEKVITTKLFTDDNITIPQWASATGGHKQWTVNGFQTWELAVNKALAK